MAHKYERKGSPYYWLSIKLPSGKRKQFSSGILIDAANSKRLINKRVRDETQKEQEFAADGSSAFLRAWVDGWIQMNYKKTTADRYRNAWTALKEFLDELGILHPQEIRYKHAEQWMQWRQCPPVSSGVRAAEWNTALTDLRVLQAILQECVRREHIVAHPMLKVGYKRKAGKVKAVITLEEERHILSELESRPEWMGEAFLVLMRQGVRISEVVVPPERISLSMNTLIFIGKREKRYSVPMHPDLKALAERAQQTGRPLVELPPNAAKKFYTFFHDIGLPHISIHCTRKTVATRLYDAGVTKRHAMDFLSHSSEMVHDIYVGEDPNRLLPCIAALGSPSASGQPTEGEENR